MTSDDIYGNFYRQLYSTVTKLFAISWGIHYKVLYFTRITPGPPALPNTRQKLSDPTLGDYTGPLNIVLQFSFFKGGWADLRPSKRRRYFHWPTPSIPSGGRCSARLPPRTADRGWLLVNPLLDYRLL
ncbi:hypothetical protein CDAR_177451 [Caerostris darwini]|uniref:Uncharacterized protein n=1 Tax=Caerostris darwini TaxID=1538125 RepID=A0AAV4P402_9ARAC|nr:hypothetical protein CDAR_177451 [Caerostris darwini]